MIFIMKEKIKEAEKINRRKKLESKLENLILTSDIELGQKNRIIENIPFLNHDEIISHILAFTELDQDLSNK